MRTLLMTAAFVVAGATGMMAQSTKIMDNKIVKQELQEKAYRASVVFYRIIAQCNNSA